MMNFIIFFLVVIVIVFLYLKKRNFYRPIMEKIETNDDGSYTVSIIYHSKIRQLLNSGDYGIKLLEGNVIILSDEEVTNKPYLKRVKFVVNDSSNLECYIKNSKIVVKGYELKDYCENIK